MAKYNVTYGCGHEGVMQLVGKQKDRDWRIQQAESGDCPECWGKAKRAAEAKMPIEMIIRTTGMDKDSNGNILAEIALTGGTMPRKDEIKELGYQWGEIRGGVMDMLSVSRAPMAWRKYVPLLELDVNHPTAKQLQADAEQLGAKVVGKIGPLDLEMARKNLADIDAAQKAKHDQAAKIAEIKAPARPACHPLNSAPEGTRWNGKIYGKAGAWRVYINNNEQHITDAEANEIRAYQDARAQYLKKIETIKTKEVANA